MSLNSRIQVSIQDAIRQGTHALVWSAILDLENMANPDVERRLAVQAWQSRASIDIETTPRVEAVAEQLSEKGIKPMDALHIASAMEAGAAWFLTTDLALLRKMKTEPRMTVADPVEFIRALQETNDANRC